MEQGKYIYSEGCYFITLIRLCFVVTFEHNAFGAILNKRCRCEDLTQEIKQQFVFLGRSNITYNSRFTSV